MLTKVKAKWRENAISHFMTELIDYAGLFPPAALSLPEAMKNYQSYILSSDRWMLGPFVIPVTRLRELKEYRSLFTEQYPLRLSVILSELEELEKEIDEMEWFLYSYQEAGSIESIEMKLTEEIEPSVLKKIALQTGNYPIYCEVTGTIEAIKKQFDCIDTVNKEGTKSIGVKLRMGGIRANLFPEANKAAYVISESQKRGLFIKFTAGLHHPIREYRSEVNTKMYGFVNVFTASILAYTASIDEKAIETILLDEDPANFSFTTEGLSWKNMRVTSEEINKARSLFAHSYGSCSFDEPREELGDFPIFHEENA